MKKSKEIEGLREKTGQLNKISGLRRLKGYYCLTDLWKLACTAGMRRSKQYDWRQTPSGKKSVVNAVFLTGLPVKDLIQVKKSWAFATYAHPLIAYDYGIFLGVLDSDGAIAADNLTNYYIGDGLYNLTAMWAAHGRNPGRQPSHWKQNATSKRLIMNIVSDMRLPFEQVFHPTLSPHRRTVAHQLIALDYLQYLQMPPRKRNAKSVSVPPPPVRKTGFMSKLKSILSYKIFGGRNPVSGSDLAY